MAYTKEKAAEYNKNYRADNKTALNDRRRAYAKKIKLEGITAYGGKCNCCGESQAEFLTIDHINGRADERAVGRSYKMTGHKMWLILKKLNYPTTDYQLLCFNCNCAKSIYGRCPHKWN